MDQTRLLDAMGLLGEMTPRELSQFIAYALVAVGQADDPEGGHPALTAAAAGAIESFGRPHAGTVEMGMRLQHLVGLAYRVDAE